MYNTFIKYLALIVCSLYVYRKLLHINNKKILLVTFIPYVSLSLPIIYLLRIYIPQLSILFMVLLFAFYMNIIFKLSYNLSLIVSIISFGITYFTFTLSTILISVVGYYVFSIESKYPPNVVIMLISCITQFIITFILFRVKRLKNGMPFLHDYGSKDIIVYISVLLLLTTSFFCVQNNARLIFIIPFFFSLLCGISLFFWWRSSIKKKYIEKITSREIEELQKIIAECNIQIEQLRYHNDELSKIVHKDNKLIPAMEYAVREYLTATEYAPTTSTALTKGQELLIQLSCLTKERTGILTNYETTNKKFSQTTILSIDTLLAYMSKKAQEHGINFDVTLSRSITQLIKQTIEEADLRTLLADLIENAIIATKKSSSKNILINLDFSGDCYSIDVFDSGELFKAETLDKIGLKRTTTHAKEGGSGIGLMTVFELIKKCQASFAIEELPDNQLFTKKVSVCFDQLGEFRIKTPGNEIKKLISPHSGDIPSTSQRRIFFRQQCNSLYAPIKHQ